MIYEGWMTEHQITGSDRKDVCAERMRALFALGGFPDPIQIGRRNYYPAPAVEEFMKSRLINGKELVGSPHRQTVSVRLKVLSKIQGFPPYITLCKVKWYPRNEIELCKKRNPVEWNAPLPDPRTATGVNRLNTEFTVPLGAVERRLKMLKGSFPPEHYPPSERRGYKIYFREADVEFFKRSGFGQFRVDRPPSRRHTLSRKRIESRYGINITTLEGFPAFREYSRRRFYDPKEVEEFMVQLMENQRVEPREKGKVKGKTVSPFVSAFNLMSRPNPKPKQASGPAIERKTVRVRYEDHSF